jgi:hypothetical protein
VIPLETLSGNLPDSSDTIRSPSIRSQNSIHEPLGKQENVPPVIVIDTNFVASLSDDAVPEVCTSSHSPTSVTASDQWHLAGTSVVKRRRSAKTNNSIDLERGKMPEFAPKPTSEGNADGDQGTGNLDARDSDHGSERESVISHPASLNPSFSHSQLLGLPATDTANDIGLFHAFSEGKYFRSVLIAQVGFVIMTLLVLGNLVYTYLLLRILA